VSVSVGMATLRHISSNNAPNHHYHARFLRDSFSLTTTKSLNIAILLEPITDHKVLNQPGLWDLAKTNKIGGATKLAYWHHSNGHQNVSGITIFEKTWYDSITPIFLSLYNPNI